MTPDQDQSAFLDAEISNPTRGGLLARIDAYYDTVPRATARVEEHGSLVLFVAERGWKFYARPSLVRSSEPTVGEIRKVLARQRELEVPQAVEWMHDTAPLLAGAARAAGMTVKECPLLVLESLLVPRAPDGEVGLVDAVDDVGAVQAAVHVAFRTPGTSVDEAGIAERDAAATSSDAQRGLGFTVESLREGRTVLVGAFVRGAGAVGGGSHNPRGQVSEMVGVGVLPAFRRRGLGGAVAHLLARQALATGLTTVFCGAESSDVARVYEGVGFRRIGTTCMAGID